MRLIDADEYKEKLYKMMPDFDEENDKKCIEGQTIFFCIATLNDMPTISPPPNDPLTLEELREMDGEPVWCCQYGWKICYGIVGDGDNAKMLTGCGSSLSLRGYGGGKTWLAYRRRPEDFTT